MSDIPNLSLRTKPKKSKLDPATLDKDEPGETFEAVNARVRAQDEAFAAALRNAMKRGKERVTEGVKTIDPHEGRAGKTARVSAFVPSASSLNNY